MADAVIEARVCLYLSEEEAELLKSLTQKVTWNNPAGQMIEGVYDALVEAGIMFAGGDFEWDPTEQELFFEPVGSPMTPDPDKGMS